MKKKNQDLLEGCWFEFFKALGVEYYLLSKEKGKKTKKIEVTLDEI
jgi:hypothetical protein